MAPAAAFVFAKALARQYDLDGHPSYSMRHFNSLLVNFVLWMLSAAPAKRMLQNEACVALSYIDCDGDRGFAARPFRTGVRAVWERELRGLGSNAELCPCFSPGHPCGSYEGDIISHDLPLNSPKMATADSRFRYACQTHSLTNGTQRERSGYDSTHRRETGEQ
jgi:hypothetical protein